MFSSSKDILSGVVWAFSPLQSQELKLIHRNRDRPRSRVKGGIDELGLIGVYVESQRVLYAMGLEIERHGQPNRLECSAVQNHNVVVVLAWAAILDYMG